MFIKWLGHACFILTSSDKKKIITDPYHTAPDLNYNQVNESADIVTKSHNHGDHNNTSAVKGNPVVMDKPGAQTVKGIEITSIPVFHDETGGSQRGSDLIFCFKIDGLNICHLGDLGHRLSPPQLSQIGSVDVLLIPVGGFYTLETKESSEVVASIHPRFVIPMHFKTSKVNMPISTVDNFVKDKKNVRRLNVSEIEIKLETLPSETEIIVLQPAN